MQLGYIGLGKMGSNMTERLLEKGHEVVVHDRSLDAVDRLARLGARPAAAIREVASRLSSPRVVWIMVPHQAVDAVLGQLLPVLTRGDTVVDGGNSPYRESMRRAGDCAQRGLEFLDAGVSGGPQGARTGACIMIGGKQEVFRRHEALFRDLSVENGYAWLGPNGAGHFVKMVHNGIEYGMMQALAEGFTVLRASPLGLDLTAIADLYNHRSVIESRLTGWLKEAYERFGPHLDRVTGSAAQSGEGAWTVDAARELGVPVPVIEGALAFRLQSLREPSYTGRVISALRNAFGGHAAAERK